MKNPVEGFYIKVSGKYALYALAVVAGIAVWTLGLEGCWNGFVVQVFHAPSLNFLQALIALAFYNMMLLPFYLTLPIKDTSKKPTA